MANFFDVTSLIGSAFFGIIYNGPDLILKNHILLTFKSYSYNSWKNKPSSFQELIMKISYAKVKKLGNFL